MFPVYRSRFACLASAVKPVAQPISKRTLVFVRDGQVKVRGLKKDPQEYMSNPSGIEYPGPANHLDSVRKFVGDKWTLSESLLLQTVTHKSFAHGKKPYNEKLAIIGHQFLRVETSRVAVEQSATQPGYLVNGRNFDVSQNAVELLASTSVLARVAELAQLTPALFWKPAQEGGRSSETVSAKTVSALVGAVLVEHGSQAASEFVTERLVKGPYSVFALAADAFKVSA